MNKLRFFIMVFILVIKMQAQEREMVHGRVMSNGVALMGVHIQNLQKEVFTITNEDGYFSIKALIGNTLQLTYVGMETTFRKVIKEDFDFAGIEIEMKQQVIELEGVEVSKYQKITAQDLGILQHNPMERTFTEKRLYKSMGGGGAMVDLIINAITGKTKMLKKVVVNEKNLAIATYIRQEIGDFLKKELKISDENVEMLSYYVMENPEIHDLVARKDNGELRFKLMDAWRECQIALQAE